MTTVATHREFLYTQNDFNKLREISNAKTGIVVSDDKFDMFYSRLSRRLRSLEIKTFSEYLAYLKKDPAEEKNLINAITTNLTAFFREKHHFDYLTNTALPTILKNNHGNSVSIWSAGCSTGEEPYSLAMTLEEFGNNKAFNYSLFASDIDSEVLSKASSGIYDIARVEGLDKRMLKHWFHKGVGQQKGKVKVKKSLCEKIQFFQLNLMGMLPEEQHDVIFCRNVLIYFDHDTKVKLIEKFSKVLKPGGYLIIGHSESLYNVSKQFDLIGNTIYQKNS